MVGLSDMLHSPTPYIQMAAAAALAVLLDPEPPADVLPRTGAPPAPGQAVAGKARRGVLEPAEPAAPDKTRDERISEVGPLGG